MSRSSARRFRSFIRIWFLAVVGAVLGFVLVMAARGNVDGFMATAGAVIGVVSVFIGFAAFIAYVIIAVLRAVRHRPPSHDDRNTVP